MNRCSSIFVKHGTEEELRKKYLSYCVTGINWNKRQIITNTFCETFVKKAVC